MAVTFVPASLVASSDIGVPVPSSLPRGTCRLSILPTSRENAPILGSERTSGTARLTVEFSSLCGKLSLELYFDHFWTLISCLQLLRVSGCTGLRGKPAGDLPIAGPPIDNLPSMMACATSLEDPVCETHKVQGQATAGVSRPSAVEVLFRRAKCHLAFQWDIAQACWQDLSATLSVQA
jgi:hypothetical protein